VAAQRDTAESLSTALAAGSRASVDFLRPGPPFDPTTLDALMSRYVMDANEGDLASLFALRRRLVVINRAAQPLIGPGSSPAGPYATDRVSAAFSDTLSRFDDVQRWLAPKLAAPPLRVRRRWWW
jgi:hypothetical protein